MYSKINKITKILIFFILITNTGILSASTPEFNNWLTSFKNLALKKGISPETINIVFKDVRFLEKVIQYDRKQPEFIEDPTAR